MLALAKKLNASTIFYDEYETVTQAPQEEMFAWMRRGGDYNQLKIPKLAADLARLKAETKSSYIVFETLLGKHHHDSGQHIDYLIWLDLPLDIALSRNIQKFSKSILNNKQSDAHGFVSWLNQYLDNYLSIVRETLEVQAERIANSADLIVDAQLSTEEMLEKVMLSGVCTVERST